MNTSGEGRTYLETGDMWIRIEAEIEGAAAQLDTVVEPHPHLPTAARRSGSVGGAAIALEERLAQRSRHPQGAGRDASGLRCLNERPG